MIWDGLVELEEALLDSVKAVWFAQHPTACGDSNVKVVACESCPCKRKRRT